MTETLRAEAAGERLGRRLEFRGVVQGVGFRPWLVRLASSIGVEGSVRNDGRGVTVEAFGTFAQLEALVERARREAPDPSAIEALEACDIAAEPARGFRILTSARPTDELRVSIPPDLAICDACLEEILDPKNRRYRYAFTSCTCCGPRFTIAHDVPYDRENTTMRTFRMCPECAREYETPEDRRFHAQPNACPACGPRLALLDAQGTEIPVVDALVAAGRALREGLVVAVKGLGGFHLACDATSSFVVATLRARKHRASKPLAVMVEDLQAAERVAVLSDEERRLLRSVERPIVIVPLRPEAALARGVSLHAPSVGLMLAYTPLHVLLLREAGRPLVMTSGNLSDEPIAVDNREAVLRLAGIADRFLVHDRAIDARADDSVTRVIAGRPTVLRRSRGFVPRGVTVPKRFARPVLATGAHLKNTFALGRGDTVMLGPHVGDLENVEAYAALESTVARMERFLDLVPELVACDLHPEYLSSRYARERATALGVPLVAVQHHHAHVASAMAEHGLMGPVLGLAWDGTGLGTDGTSWGGELLLATFDGFERIATFRPIALAGGDRAIREVWRVALALLDDAFQGDPPVARLEALATRAPKEIHAVRQLVAANLNAPRAHGVGRLFDAVGAVCLGEGIARHEAQVAMALEWAAGAREEDPYPFTLDRSCVTWQVDTRPLVRALVADVLAGRPAALCAARFHDTLGAIARALLHEATSLYGALPVVLTGGCFQNARLVEACVRQTSRVGIRVRVHERVPPGDGGIALGQALIADAVIRKGGVG
jgi:hydrogenase maturation protein HypF